MAARPWEAAPGGVVLTVRLTPKGGRDALDGLAELADGSWVLKARVRAVASGGEANAALVRLLAATLAVPARDIRLVAGASARLKRLQIAGSAAALAATLEAICADARSRGGARANVLV